MIGGDDTYSRYKIKKPIAPPDYGGTAIQLPSDIGELENVEAPEASEEIEASENIEPVENIEKIENIENTENTEKIENTEQVRVEETESAKNESLSIDELTLDDLLFMGAAALLMSGRMGDESMLLLSYLLTCGL